MPEVTVDDVQLMIIIDEKITKFKNFIGDVNASKKSTVAEKEARTKNKNEKMVSWAWNPIP